MSRDNSPKHEKEYDAVLIVVFGESYDDAISIIIPKAEFFPGFIKEMKQRTKESKNWTMSDESYEWKEGAYELSKRPVNFEICLRMGWIEADEHGYEAELSGIWKKYEIEHSIAVPTTLNGRILFCHMCDFA